MALYEVTLIVRQDVPKADANKLTDSYAKLVGELGGKVEKNEYWGLRNLAYIINKSRKGHYSFLAIDADAAALKELERKLRLDENVVRHLTVRVEAFTETPGAVFQNSSSYEDSAA